jgi:hypothetical protein
MSEELAWKEVVIQSFWKIKRRIKRRKGYVTRLISSAIGIKENRPTSARKAAPLQAGDTVRVRSKKEIGATLDFWNRLDRCVFMEEMAAYCETEHRVLKRVERFLDERDYLMKKVKGIVLLENAICRGTIDFGKCDRSCFFFWKEEWLQKVD